MSTIVDFTDPYMPFNLTIEEKQAIGRVVVPVPESNTVFEATVDSKIYRLTLEQTQICTSSLQQSQAPTLDLSERNIVPNPYALFPNQSTANLAYLSTYPQVLKQTLGVQNFQIKDIHVPVIDQEKAIERLQLVGPFTLLQSPKRLLPQVQFTFPSQEERLKSIRFFSQAGVKLARKDSEWQTPEPVPGSSAYTLALSHPQSCTFLGLNEQAGKDLLEMLFERQNEVREEPFKVIQNRNTHKSTITIDSDYAKETRTIDLGNNFKIHIKNDKATIFLQVEISKVRYPDSSNPYGVNTTIWKEIIPHNEAGIYLEKLKKALESKLLDE